MVDDPKLNDRIEKVMKEEHLDPQTAERKAVNEDDTHRKARGKTVTFTIEWEPVDTGTDTPQDVLNDAIEAVRRHGGRIVSSKGADPKPAPHTQEDRLTVPEAQKMAEEQHERDAKAQREAMAKGRV